MRLAPIGLYFDGKKFPQDGIDRMGAEAAALTHGHELGYIPAAAFVHIVSLLAHNEDISVLSAVKDSMSAMERLFPEAIHMGELLMLSITIVEDASNGTIRQQSGVLYAKGSNEKSRQRNKRFRAKSKEDSVHPPCLSTETAPPFKGFQARSLSDVVLNDAYT